MQRNKVHQNLKSNNHNENEVIFNTEYLFPKINNFTSVLQNNNNLLIKNTHHINLIDTEILIPKNFSHGFVKELIQYELTKGKYDKIVRKISLGGTSDKIHSFKIGSR